jgi:hypothetical protein
MSTSFSSTLRTLQNDPQTFSMGWIVLISLLLLGWLSWFLFAPLSRSVEGVMVHIDGDGVVLAQFPGEVANQLQIGQKSAILLKDGGQNQSASIPATLSNILPQIGDTPSQVEFYVDLDAPSASAFHSGITGTVSVVVEQISPAMQVWRTTGQFIDTLPIQVE